MALETRDLRAQLQTERERLSDAVRALSEEAPQGAARLVGEVVAMAIAQAAVESIADSLDERPLPVVADGARLHALDALAAAAGEPARSVIAERRRSLAEAHPYAVAEAADLAEVSLAPDAQREAVVAGLEGPELDAAVADPLGWPAGALAERLAELGRIEAARAFVDRWAPSGWHHAHAMLRAAAHAPEALGPGARGALGALDREAQGDLCGKFPTAAVRVLGADDALRIAGEAFDDTGQYVRMVALARLASALPEPQRSDAAARALRSFREDPDTDALEELVKCAPWMPIPEAAALLADHLGLRATPGSFENAFAGFAGIASFTPLIARAAGDAGLLAAADAVAAAEAWSRAPDPPTPRRGTG